MLICHSKKNKFMLKKHLNYFCFLLVLLLMSCAKRGSITGGLKDTIAPVLKVSFPKNYSTNFKGSEVKLTFDEYVKLKNSNKQLIISPPLAKTPQILPSTASKVITIKFNDSLQANTTYSLNFGQSIEDNNEGNPYTQFKYVFSTGTYIDSLALNGTIKDAYDKKTDNFVSVMLYEMNEKFKDSVIYKENPRYITNTLDSANTFKLENLKAGKYLLVALKDENSNNKFEPKKEKIAFLKKHISIPNDTLFELALFKETSPFLAFKPSQASANRLTMGYEGNPKNLKITLKNKSETIPCIITKLPEKDSVQIWFNPLKTDTLRVAVSKEDYKKDFTFKIKTEKKDSLNFSMKQGKILPLGAQFTLKSSVPLSAFDPLKMELINKDSVAVAFSTKYDDWNQELHLDFQKNPAEKYRLKLLPGAITDFMDRKSDSLRYEFETTNLSDYGNLRLKLEKVKQFPIIVELTNSKGEIVASAYSENNTTLDFNLLEPNLFSVRVIYDENKNKEWDSGNYLEKRQAEEVFYFPKEIDVRANWDVEQVFDLSIPYRPESKKKNPKKKS